jgi:iron-sulfur cluster repair protein YtfE (RIC family)
MEDIVALIDRLIDEHKVIVRDARSLEQVANDASALADLAEARETFVPGRFDQKQSLQKLQESLEAIDQGLQAHFHREETGILTAFEKHGDRKLVTTLNSLLLEHEDLRNRLAHSREHVAELVDGGLARHRWEASANDMRAHISHTLRLLEAHAAIENELFIGMRQHLQGESDRKEAD